MAPRAGGAQGLKLASLRGTVAGADFAPTQGMRDVSEDLAARVDVQIARWTAIAEHDVPAFDRLVRSAGLPLVGAGATARRRGAPRKAARRRAGDRRATG